MNVEIKITGNGTIEEVTKALESVIGSLIDVSANDRGTIVEWEDPTLYTIVKVI